MLQEVETYCLLCLQINQQNLIEDTYKWLFEHHALSAQIKLKYGLLIFTIEQYRPKTDLEKHFQKIFELFKDVKAQKLDLTKEDMENLVSLCRKLLEFIDRQSWKKEIYTALQALGSNSNAIQEYKRYVDNLIAASEIYFEQKPMDVAYNKQVMTNFARFISAESVVSQLYSAEWNTFIKHLEIFSRNQFFANTVGDFDSNPVQMLIHAILDVD